MKKRWIYSLKIFIISILINFFVFFYIYLSTTKSNEFQFVLFIGNILVYILAVMIGIGIITSKKYSYNKTLWLMLLFLNPLSGILLYSIFARDFKTNSVKFERPLLKNDAYLDYEPYHNQLIDDDVFTYLHKNSKKSVFIDNTKTTILTNGENFFPLLKEKIINAKESICMAFYIIQNDELANEILRLLIDKAKSGVKVWLLYDYLGAKSINKKIIKELKAVNVEVSIFEKFTLTNYMNALNYRYHRKLVIIDGKYGFIGGMNLGKEYNHQSKKYGFWRDTHLMMEGEGIVSLANIFKKDWYYSTGKWIDFTYNYEKIVSKGLVASVESGVDHNNPIIKEIYFKMINNAKKNIYITTPYLMIEPDLELALITASKSGIEVNILLPGKPDKFLINHATKSYYENLLKNGINIYEYNQTFVHAKCLIVDEEIASLGTVNMDPRSFNLNFEATVFMKNDSVNHLVNDFKNDLIHSSQINLNKWQKRSLISKILQGLVGLFSPLF